MSSLKLPFDTSKYPPEILRQLEGEDLSTYKPDEIKKYLDDLMEEENSSSGDREEKFQLEKFLSFFEKRGIVLESIWLLDNRVQFLNISYKADACEIFVYIQSKYHFTADGSFVAPKYRLVGDEDEDVKWPSDIHSTNVKDWLERCVEHVKSQPLKLMYRGKRDMLMINRHNDLDNFRMELPGDTGFFYVTDWDTFFNRWKEIPNMADKIDKLLAHVTFDSHSVRDIGSCLPAVVQLAERLKKWNSTEIMKMTMDRFNKLDGLLQKARHDPKTIASVVTVRNKTRSKSLNQYCMLSSLGDTCQQLINTLQNL